jgi:uncharacterized protein involved in response to NO
MTASLLLHLDEPPAPRQAPGGFALWALGFRPFYLLAGGFAALSVVLWSLQFIGWLPRPYLAGPLWHAHEMVFGFTLAVVVGFLFTAGRNWSGRPTPTGRTLMTLAALWLAGRVLVLTPWGLASAVVNAAFPLAAAIGLAIPFWRARIKRNYFFVGLLVLMGMASAGIHLSQHGAFAVPAWLSIQLALDVVLFIMAVMGGRVIPMFTNNGVPNAGAVRHPWVERLALGSVLVLLVSAWLPLQGTAMALIAAGAAVAHGVRLALWRPWKTTHTPLVWVLHAGYAWIVLHLVFRAMAALGWVAPSAAIHALTVGAIGSLVIGMMTRTARGHTARPLKADRADTSAYLLISAAALVRVLLPLVWPAATMTAIAVSAALWSAGFGLYAVCYWPVLSRPRLDGQPG